MEQERDVTAEPLGKVIQRYRVEHATLNAHQRELDRRRVAVRAAAERDASEIIATARRDVRGVLLRARQELVALAEQVRAAGCEFKPGEPGDFDDFHLPAAREVGAVLRDARAELADLSRDAAGLRGVEADHRNEQTPIVRLVEQFAAHWRIALVALVLVAVGAITLLALRPAAKTEDAPSTSRSEAASPQETAATEQAALNPTATRGSDMHSVKPASASGVAASTKPSAAVPATVARQTAVSPKSEPPKRAPAAADNAAAVEQEILERHRRWFDAFDRNDRVTMSSLASDNFSIVDERPEHASASGRVGRTIRDLRVRVNGVGAVVSGQIAETTADDAVAVAMLSEVWIRRGEEWRLVSVRMVPLNAVPTTLQ